MLFLLGIKQNVTRTCQLAKNDKFNFLKIISHVGGHVPPLVTIERKSAVSYGKAVCGADFRRKRGIGENTEQGFAAAIVFVLESVVDFIDNTHRNVTRIPCLLSDSM